MACELKSEAGFLSICDVDLVCLVLPVWGLAIAVQLEVFFACVYAFFINVGEDKKSFALRRRFIQAFFVIGELVDVTFIGGEELF